MSLSPLNFTPKPDYRVTLVVKQIASKPHAALAVIAKTVHKVDSMDMQGTQAISGGEEI